ncbi:uncharacterized protein [Panulirus ornatus]|uniref:uncharacterized protein isoform X2 n=1 Tax=Panulirus ornatus TaxID=150431 RepID=UPI003A8685D3
MGSCETIATSLRVASVLWMAAVSVSVHPSVSTGPVMRGPEGVGTLLSLVVEQHLEGCHLVLLTAGQDSLVFNPIVRALAEDYQAGLLVDAWRLFLTIPEDSILLQHLREGDAKFPCRAVIIDFTNGGSTEEVYWFLEESHLYLWPETRVVVVGDVNHVHMVLNHRVFRNTANTLYLALHAHALIQNSPPQLWVDTTAKAQTQNNCTAQDLIAKGPRDQFQNFQGHTFRIVSMKWFPFLEFTLDSNASATTVTPRDSLDYRSLTSMSSILNFTYVMRTPWDSQWGVSQGDGNWTGTVGTLQHHQADFSMLLSWLGSRMAVVDYSRVYVSEPLVIVTSKLGPLPQIFALVRPFPVMLWMAILFMCMVIGVTMWMLQGLRTRVSGGRRMELSFALMQAWGILLEDPPPRLSTNITGRMLVGWWWVFCMLITSAYRSSLIAHLSVPDKSPTIDTLEQLLNQDGWTWGMEGTYGIGWEWFKESTLPTVQQIYQRIKAMDADEHLERVLRGRHAFLTWKYYIRTIIASRFTDSFGYTPIYTGRSEYINYGGYGWGFRKGAPFRKRIDGLKQRLLEGGLINFWMNDLILAASREARRNNAKNEASPREAWSSMGEARMHFHASEEVCWRSSAGRVGTAVCVSRAWVSTQQGRAHIQQTHGPLE